MTMLAAVLASAQMAAGTDGGPDADGNLYAVTVTVPSGAVGATLTDFPVMVRLSAMPGGFWSHVRSDGADIRVWTSGGVATARDLARFDYVAQDGVLFFRAPSLASGSDTTFTIRYGNAALTPYVPTVTALTVTNPSAEVNAAGWTNVVGILQRRTSDPAPPNGGAGYFTFFNVAEGRSYQSIAIPSGQQAAVDAGEVIARLRWLNGGFGGADTDTAEMEMEFFDGSMFSLGTRLGAGLWLSPRAFESRELQLRIPSATRTVRIFIHALRGSGTNNDGYVDEISLALVEPNPLGTEKVWKDYDAVYLLGETPFNRRGGRALRVTGDPNFFLPAATSPDLAHGHEGVTFDGTHFYVIDERAIRKYDASWTLVASNTNITAGAGNPGLDQLNDGDIYDGKLWIPANVGTGRYIAKFNTSDLTFDSAVNVTGTPTAGFAGIAYYNSLFYGVFFTGTPGSSIVRKMGLDGSHQGDITLSEPLIEMQGLTVWRGAFWVAVDRSSVSVVDADETYRVEFDGFVHGASGLFGNIGGTGVAWEGLVGYGDALYLFATVSGQHLVYTFKPYDLALSAGGGADWPVDARLSGELARLGSLGSAWTLGCSFAKADAVQRCIMSLSQLTGSTGNVRVEIDDVNDTGVFKLGVWDSNNLWHYVSPDLDPTVGIMYRVNVIYNGTTARHIFANGGSKTSSGAITARGASLVKANLGSGQPDAYLSPWRGKIGFAYVRAGVLSDAWIAAEYANLNAPDTFGVAGSEVEL